MSEANARKPSIVLVDDQPEFLTFMRARLTRSSALDVVGQATSGESALRLIQGLQPAPDVVLVDVEMPGLDGFETTRRVRDVAPGARIILTSASDSPHYGRAAISIGARFVPKRSLSVETILQLLD